MTVPAPQTAADPDQVITGPDYRISILTSRLVRFEYNPTGNFVDRPTQLVTQRRFPKTPFEVVETADQLEIFTEHLQIRYDKGPFTQTGLSVKLRSAAGAGLANTWHFGDQQPMAASGHGGNLGGTVSTLDEVDGTIPLEPGLFSTQGYTVVDDSNSVELTDDDWIEARTNPGQDLYFFGYGRDYSQALKDYFVLTGDSPLLPRWVLGNWWSRYHPYTADEYLALMDKFRAEGLPFSVAVIDMDWHVTDVDPAIGTGWTGYTWNKKLFPNPPQFLKELHDRGMHTSLNVHPADGVRRHEDAYQAVAEDLGMDPAQGREIAFDITNRAFVDSYFKRLHHPLEEEGVDFWWLDWQSGGISKVPGLDPLWMLNHLHYHDSARDGDRPLTFSRYAGLGSHRYPIGFSGDTVVSWDSLNFQPYFTATAANVGYFWWSHDIGGHMFGIKDNELATRWYQLGVFSPINRLHSTFSQFNSKEPWRYGPRAQKIATEFLQLRHQLVPYLYSAMWQAHTQGIAPVRPMYHEYADENAAYSVPNQFMFGPDLLVAPITTKEDRQTHLAAVETWLPAGEWFDFFTGRRYQGGRKLSIHRRLEEMPVFARAGSIIVLAEDPFADVAKAPSGFVVRVFPGSDAAAEIIEDDGTVEPCNPLRLNWHLAESDNGKTLTITLAPVAEGGSRNITLEIIGIAGAADVGVVGAGQTDPHLTLTDGVIGYPVVRLELGAVDLAAGLTVTLRGVEKAPNQVKDEIFALLDDAEIEYDTKEKVARLVEFEPSVSLLISGLTRLKLPGNLYGAIVEVLATE